MVTYLPSSASRQISVVEMEYSTFMKINAEATVPQNTPFPLTGRLYFMEGPSEMGLGNRTINLSYNGISLGSVQTDGDGYYSLSVMIPTSGTYTLTASYAGEVGLGPSSATMRLAVGEISPTMLIAGLIIAAYLLMRK